MGVRSQESGVGHDSWGFSGTGTLTGTEIGGGMGMIFVAIWVMMLFFAPVEANPWGKDAELAVDLFLPPPQEPCCHTSKSPFAALGETMIVFHQTVITQIDGPRSNYLPSSSQYTLDAMRAYGFFRGVAYGCDRLMRENSETWVYPNTIGPYGLMKYDPVK